VLYKITCSYFYYYSHLVRICIWSPVWARGRCPPRFLAECCKRQLNQGSCVLLYFRLFTFSDLYWVCLYFPVLFCLSVLVKWLTVKTTPERTSVGWGIKLYSNQICIWILIWVEVNVKVKVVVWIQIQMGSSHWCKPSLGSGPGLGPNARCFLYNSRASCLIPSWAVPI